MLTDKDRSIITQVAFKGTVDAQTLPLNTTEGQGEFAVNFSFLKDILFSEVGGPAPAPAVAPAAQPTQPAENVVHAHFPGSTTLSVRNPDEQQGPLPTWLIEQAAAVGVTEVWDNRNRLDDGKAKGKNWPWFRSAHENIDKAFWPPRAS